MKSIGWIIKSGLFTFCVHILVLLDMVLLTKKVIMDVTSVLILLAILIIAAPLYFAIKGDASRPVVYLILSEGFHIVWTLLGCAYAMVFHPGWDSLNIFCAELCLTVFFVIIAVLDILAMAIPKLCALPRRTPKK